MFELKRIVVVRDAAGAVGTIDIPLQSPAISSCQCMSCKCRDGPAGLEAMPRQAFRLCQASLDHYCIGISYIGWSTGYSLRPSSVPCHYYIIDGNHKSR